VALVGLVGQALVRYTTHPTLGRMLKMMRLPARAAGLSALQTFLETGFSTFGRTVVLHANGFEVDSLIPGGERMKISGASMAAPQVTNLAAKLLALDASLTPPQLKSLILDHAERRGRVNLVNPRASVQALRQRLV
jgi:subtilisin family serine protease